MRRLSTVLAAACLAVFVSAVPASAQSFSWTGFYIGGHVGFGVNNPDANVTELDFWNGVDTTIPGNGGFSWGGHAGYQFAATRKLIFAGEFGIGMNGYNGDSAYAFPGFSDDTKVSYEGMLNWHGLGRVGWNLGKVMPYFTLGVVGISTDVEALDDCNTGTCGGGLAHATASGSATDFTWGFGAEFGIGRRPLTVRAEWLLSDFRTPIEATDSEQEMTWLFEPHYPKGVIRILVNWRIGGSERR